jgi:hypothetical protein
MRHRTVCFRSSPQYLPDTVLPMPFPRSLTTTPFERSSTGRFKGFCAGICKTPRFYWGWALSLSEPAAVVAVEMWEPAFGAGFQARWDGQQIFGQDAARGPTERHFHSEPGILPILMRILSLAAAQDQNVRFQKPTQNEHFYRLSCRAQFSQ